MLNPNVIAELDRAQVETEGGVVEGVERIAASSYQFEENYSARLGDAYLFTTPNGGYRVRAEDVRDVREL